MGHSRYLITRCLLQHCISTLGRAIGYGTIWGQRYIESRVRQEEVACKQRMQGMQNLDTQTQDTHISGFIGCLVQLDQIKSPHLQAIGLQFLIKEYEKGGNNSVIHAAAPNEFPPVSVLPEHTASQDPPKENRTPSQGSTGDD